MAGMISQKCYYAIKALFDLAQHKNDPSTKIGLIADRQNIPIRFLEAILRQLKQAGYVQSRRGAEGGYALAQSPSRIKLIDVITFFEGDFAQFSDSSHTPGETKGDADSVLMQIWENGRKAMMAALEKWSIADLVEKAAIEKTQFSNFVI